MVFKKGQKTFKPKVAEVPVEEVVEKPPVSDKEIVKTMVALGPDDRLSRFMQEPEKPFVDTGSEEFTDPFKVPKWVDETKYAYAWADKNDEIEMDEYVYSGVWRVVNRVNHYNAPSSAFHSGHGAVERRGLILVFRPKELREKTMKQRAQAHLDLRRSNQEKFQDRTPIETTADGKVLSGFYSPDDSAPETMTQEIPYTSRGE